MCGCCESRKAVPSSIATSQESRKYLSNSSSLKYLVEIYAEARSTFNFKRTFCQISTPLPILGRGRGGVWVCAESLAESTAVSSLLRRKFLVSGRKSSSDVVGSVLPTCASLVVGSSLPTCPARLSDFQMLNFCDLATVIT